VPNIWRKATGPRMIERMMRSVLLLFALLLAPAAAEAQPVLVSADMRQAVDLDGPWNWSVDPYRDGLSGFHGGEAAPGHRRYEEIDTTAAMRADSKALYEYDLDRSPVVHLPQSFVTHSPDMRRYSASFGINAISPRMQNAVSALSCASGRSIITPTFT
jgi:beta-glucuronidase